MSDVTQHVRKKFHRLVPNGTCVEFSQDELLAGSGADDEGVCFELSRRWVLAVLEHGDRFDPDIFRADHYSLTRGELRALVRQHKERGTVDSGNFTVRGTTRDLLVTRRRGGRLPSLFRHVVLRNREAVLQQMWTNPGVYLYGFKGHGGGHVVGFEFKRDSRIRFFDPNLGLYEIPGWSEMALNRMRQFFHFVWELPWVGGSYKRMARRTLVADKFRVLARIVLNDD